VRKFNALSSKLIYPEIVAKHMSAQQPPSSYNFNSKTLNSQLKIEKPVINKKVILIN